MTSDDRDIGATIRAVARSLIFILKALPATSGAIDRVTTAPIIEKFTYPTPTGQGEAELYRPPSPGPHPGVVVSLGVVPAGVDHPQRARFGQAVARSGFAALLHWSPAMRDLRLDPADVGELASAYRSLIEQPYVDPTRSGMMGTCVGGSFALMAAAEPSIRDRMAFVSAYAPVFVDVDPRQGCGHRVARDRRRARALADRPAGLEDLRALPDRATGRRRHERLRDAFEDRFTWNASKTLVVEAAAGAPLDPIGLSADGRAVLRLLEATDPDAVDDALGAAAVRHEDAAHGDVAHDLPERHPRAADRPPARSARPHHPRQRIAAAVVRAVRPARCQVHGTGVPASGSDQAVAASTRPRDSRSSIPRCFRSSAGRRHKAGIRKGSTS